MPDRAPPPRPAPRALAVAALACALPLALAGGCSIERPELPRFTTTVTLPLGTERVTVAEIAEGESFLSVGADSLLAFAIAGEADTLAVELDLTADLPAAVVITDLGSFTLDAAEPATFDFALRELYPAVEALDGATVPVPSFSFDLASEAADLQDVTSASVVAGRLEVTVTNGLPVAISAATPPALVTIDLVDPATGAVLATAEFSAPVPAGASAAASADLAGAILPDSISVRLRGGSPGSATPVTVDADARLGVSAQLRDLQVSTAVAVVGPIALSATATVALPDSLRLIEAEIVSGSLAVTIASGLAIPCQVALTLPELLAADERPVATTLSLAPGETASRTIALDGTRIRAPDLEPITALTAIATVTSTGSGGLEVALSASDDLRADLAPSTLRFGAVTGVIPERTFVLDPLEVEIDLPEELDGLAFTSATLTLSVDNSAAVPGQLAFTLTGRSATGEVATLSAEAAITPALERAPGVTDIVLDETNSGLVDFLNILPVEITLDGAVTIGGDDVIGTVRPGDRAIVGWRLDAPLRVVVIGATVLTDPQPLELDPDLRDELTDRLGAALVVTEITNHLPLGVAIRLLAGTDPATVSTAPQLTVGPFLAQPGRLDPLRGTVVAATVTRSEATLTAAQADILTLPGLHIVIEITVPSSGGQPVTLLAGDWVSVVACVRAELEVSE